VAKGRPGLARDSIGVFATQVLVMLIGIGTSVLTARTLGAQGRGLFNLLILLPTTLSNFVKLGVPQGNVYFIRKRGASASAVASNSLWLALGLGMLCIAVAWEARAWLLANIMKSDAPPATLPMVLVLLPFVLIQVNLQAVLTAQQRFREYNLQNLIPVLVGAAGLVVVLAWTQDRPLEVKLVSVVLTQSLIQIGTTVWLMMRVHRTAPLGLTWDWKLARETLRFGRKSYVQTLASTMHFRIDQFMIAYLLGPTEVGIYAVAVNLTNLLLRISDATGTVLYPHLAGAGEREAHAATSRTCRQTLFATGAAALGYVLFGPLAIRLYGPQFAGSVRPMLLMLPGIVMIALYLILTRNFTSRNRQMVNIVAAVAALAINVGANWVLIPRFGIAGAAVSTSISYSAAALILLFVFVRESGRSVVETVFVGPDEVGRMVRNAVNAMRPAAN
jgi:O-antigen/teichoic acid export membrane protein